MMLRQKQTLAPKIKLNQTLRSWLPILQSGLDELKETLEPFIKENPFATIEHKNLEKSEKKRNFIEQVSKNSVSESIEALSIYKESLYEKLVSQINPPLFPTQKSQDIAYKIIECLDDEGYFSYDDEIFAGLCESDVERVRARFAYLEPCGVGAKDVKESFLFQLSEAESSEEIIECARKIILNFENIEKIESIANNTVLNAKTFSDLFVRLDPLAMGKRPAKRQLSIENEISNCFAIFRQQMEDKSIKFDISGSAIIEAWQQDIAAIFTNLIDNSIFWLSEKNTGIRHIMVNIFSEGNTLSHIDFRDTGPGIEPYLIEDNLIFEPQFSTKPSGTGIGLAIAGEAAERNGLKLTVLESTTGAYFRLSTKGYEDE